MDSIRVIKIFLASPMDVLNERKSFMNILAKINDTIGRTFRIQYEVHCWEHDVTPDKGDDAQDVVNSQVAMDYDVFVGVFKDRIGTPTGRSISGTVEEYERALIYRNSNQNLKIMCYYLETQTAVPEIVELKQKMKDDGILYSEVKDTAAFEDAVFKHFSNIMLKNAKSFIAEQKKASENRKKVSVSIALISENNELLIVRRSMNLKAAPGYWQIPGGKVENGEEPGECAVREAKEELNVVLHKDKLTLLNVFHTYYLNDKSRPFDMYLFCYELEQEQCKKVKLNSENSDYEWINLSSPDLEGKQFFGINQDMFETVWRERGIARTASLLLEYCNQIGGNELPKSLPGVSPWEIHNLYALLSVLGIVKVTDKIRLASAHSKKLLEAVISISRSGGEIFDDSEQDPVTELKIPIQDHKVLCEHRGKALYSHKSLLAMLSCKTSMAHSVRDICNVLIMGKYQDELYLLLRWDFYADKYQILSGNTDKLNEDLIDLQARNVIARRLGELASRHLNYLHMKDFTTQHFSAGSVDNDPILRQYNIKVIGAFVRNNNKDDFLESIRRVNTTTELMLEYIVEITEDQCKELNCFSWCNLNDLLDGRTTYSGRQVRGFEELINNIGKNEILQFADKAVELTKEDVEGNLDYCIKQIERKRK